MDLRYAASVLLPRWPILLVSAILAGTLAYFASGLLPQTFESQATLLVADQSGRPPAAYEDLLAAQILAGTYAELGRTTPILGAALERAGVNITIDEFEDVAIVESVGTSTLVAVTVRARSAQEARQLTDALATEVAALAPATVNGMQLSIVDPASEPDDPVSPRPMVNAALGAGVAMMLAAGVLLLAARLRRGAVTRCHTRHDARRQDRVRSDPFVS